MTNTEKVNQEDKQAWQANLPEDEKTFEANVRHLAALLDEPHPGLMTWNLMLQERMKGIADFMMPHLKSPELAKKMLQSLSEYDRVGVMEKFCRGCGTDKLPCYCMRDD